MFLSVENAFINIIIKVFKFNSVLIHIMSDGANKKRRGRKPKIPKPVAVRKKRGRKPKGGKIIKKEDLPKSVNKKVISNIILHLKCFTSDLEATLPMETTIQSFQINSGKKDKGISFEEFNMR